MKALEVGDLNSAALLIKLGADICLGGGGRQSPVGVIFGKNIVSLKKVIKEYFSAKRYKEFEGKYSICHKIQSQSINLIFKKEEKVKNTFLESNQERRLKTPIFPDLSKSSLPTKKPLYSSQDKSKTPVNRLNGQSLLKKQTESEENLTSNTNHEKLSPTLGIELNHLPESKPNISPKYSLHNYKQRITAYSDQIKLMKEKIEVTKLVSL